MQSHDFLISVVIPCYNVESYVEEAVESVMKQTYRHVEIICVDDGSTDGTLEKLKVLETIYAGKITVFTGPNSGAPSARNKGLFASQGEYVQFLDADDILDPQKIEHQVDIVRRSAYPLDLVAGSSKKICLDGSEIYKKIESLDPWVALLQSRLGNTCSNLWRRSMVVEIGGWNEALASSQEAELMFRMLKHGAQVGFDDICLTNVRQRTGSISNTLSNKGENWKRYINLRCEMLRYLRANNLLSIDRERAAFQTLFQAIRYLYAFDPVLSVSLYQERIPRSFNLMTGASITPLYVLLFRLLGFERTERLRALVRKIR